MRRILFLSLSILILSSPMLTKADSGSVSIETLVTMEISGMT